MDPPETSDLRPRPGSRWPRLSALIVGAVLAMALWMSFVSVATPVSITVPLREAPVADSDLDGEPSTGAWSDALAVEMPLENGAQAPYGTATLYAKHDGSNLFMRLDRLRRSRKRGREYLSPHDHEPERDKDRRRSVHGDAANDRAQCPHGGGDRRE